MKSIAVALVASLALTGVAVAGEDESAVTIDLTGASKDSNAYFLKCQWGGKSLSTCGTPTVWENTNGEKGLQTSVSMMGTPPDKAALS